MVQGIGSLPVNDNVTHHGTDSHKLGKVNGLINSILSGKPLTPKQAKLCKKLDISHLKGTTNNVS